MSKKQSTQQVFRHVFHSKRWGNAESASGPGSTLRATRPLLAILPEILKRLSIKSLVDAPCGDAHWIRHLDYTFDEYIGVDIVPELISRLQGEIGDSNRRFMVGDITTDVLPKADAVLCRDCLVHLSFDLGLCAVKNWASAGFKYVLATTYPEIQNRDIETGKWRALDMEAAPFNFPPPMMLIVDGRRSKSLGLWKVADLFGPVASRSPLELNTIGEKIDDQRETEIAADTRKTVGLSDPKAAISDKELKTRLAEIKQVRSKKQKKQALVLAEKLYGDAPDSVKAASVYSWCLIEKREFGRALDITTKSLDKFWDWHLLSALCEIYSKLNRDEEAVRITEKYFSDPDISAYAHLLHGAALLRATGELDRCVGFFNRAAQIDSAGTLGSDCHPAREIVSNLKFEALTRVADDPSRNPIHFVGSHAEKPLAVLAASADETYFRAFFQLYRDTFFAHSPNASHIVHFHIFDPSNDLLEEISGIEEKARGRIRFSYEITGGANRSYYYAGRFVQMPRLLQRYGCPIVLTDMDCYFAGDIGEVIASSTGVDLGIVEVTRRLLPWRIFLANLVVFNPTEVAYRYALGMHNFLLNMPRDINYWYVDQLALVQCAYLNRNAAIGTVQTVNEAWRKFSRQGTGSTGRPDVKADKLRKRLDADI